MLVAEAIPVVVGDKIILFQGFLFIRYTCSVLIEIRLTITRPALSTERGIAETHLSRPASCLATLHALLSGGQIFARVNVD